MCVCVIYTNMGFSYGSDGKESACNAGDPGSIPGLGRSLREGNDNPLKYSCLENSMDRGACRAIVHGVTKSQTQLSLSTFVNIYITVDTYYTKYTIWVVVL